MSQIEITGTDLDDWASRRDAQSRLPRLVRRLVRATAGPLTRLDFPADEAVQMGGWDGIVESPPGGTFVPAGVSGWELGTTSDIRGKAESDYRKRKRDPLGLDPAETTFVFVTPRRWGGKAAWVDERRAEGFWKDVRAYDADDLEQWLDLAPQIQDWVSSDLLGRPSGGARDLEQAWRDWADATEPPTSPALAIAGRTSAEEKIARWLANPSGTLPVRGESLEEALAFFLAAVRRLPDADREAIEAGAVVVDTQEAWEWLAGTEPPLVLICAFEPNERLARAVRGGHHVVVLTGMSSEDDDDERTVVLPRPSRHAAEQALLETGLSGARARDAAAVARRSPLALRRKLAISGARRAPAWAGSPSARVILAAVFAGGWNDRVDGDREVLATLSGLPYDDFAAQLLHWAAQADPPVRRVGDTWLIAAKEDAWRLLARYLARADLERFRVIAVQVLTGADEEGQPLGAQSQRISEFLGDGIADTLALMGALGQTTRLADGSLADETAARAVRGILRQANADARIWIMNERRLRRLAEAAPQVFLDAVAAGLQGEQTVVMRMFGEGPGAVVPVSWQAGLLWALEVLAWPREYLGRAASALARLARLDPGGRTVNRPANSLREIFLVRDPRTAADLAFRRTVLERIIRDEPAVAWNLLCRLLPERHRSAAHTARPRWRDWVPEEEPTVTYAEIFATAEWAVEHLIGLAGTDGTRWAELIGHLDNVPPAAFTRVVDHLASLRPSRLGTEGKIAVWEALRTLIAKHRRYPEAKWALPAEQVLRLDRLYRRFAPGDLVERYAYLFGNAPALLRPGRERRERGTLLTKERTTALKRIYAGSGLDGVRRLIAAAERPGTVGWVLGAAGLLTAAEEDAILAETLRAETGLEFVRSYVTARSEAGGEQWFAERAASVPSTDAELGRLLTALPFGGATWARAAAAGSAVEESYWKQATVLWIEDPADVEQAARSLYRFGRPLAAVELLVLHEGGVQAEPGLVADVLEAAATAPEVEGDRLGWEMSELLARLDDANSLPDERIALLEWQLLAILDSYSERPPRALHRALTSDPTFFADVVSFGYKARNDADEEDVSETDLVRAHRAYELLRSFRTVPGLGPDGSVDEETLRSWVLQAREEIKARGREVGDLLIGHVLRYAPAGADGIWPAEPVRDLIEELASDALERGLWTEIHNSRGVTTRGVTEGGGQERTIAEQFRHWAEALEGRWLRTAALLRSVAESYEGDARREDTDAELNEDYWD
ncbi:MAG: hypothetical protein H0X65_13610 [Gemmatimonadetes bacterium]|nr:hypothetical protein [Gemmatimonadota bacterium]